IMVKPRQNIMVKPQTLSQQDGANQSALLRQFENIGASLIANQLKNFNFSSLPTILEKILSLMANATQGNTQSESQSVSQNVGRRFPPNSYPFSQPATNNSTSSSESMLDKAKQWAAPDPWASQAASSGAGGPQLVYNGGKVLSNPDINNIYVG